MDEERFNLSIRRFLKSVGISSQREIEQAVAAARAAATLSDEESLPATMTLEVQRLKLSVTFEGVIDVS